MSQSFELTPARWHALMLAREPRLCIRECDRTGAQWHALTRVLQRYPLGDLHLRPLICALASDQVCCMARPQDGATHPTPLWFCSLCAETICLKCLHHLRCEPDGLSHGMVCPACLPAETLECGLIKQWIHQRRELGKRKRDSE